MRAARGVKQVQTFGETELANRKLSRYTCTYAYGEIHNFKHANKKQRLASLTPIANKGSHSAVAHLPAPLREWSISRYRSGNRKSVTPLLQRQGRAVPPRRVVVLPGEGARQGSGRWLSGPAHVQVQEEEEEKEVGERPHPSHLTAGFFSPEMLCMPLLAFLPGFSP